MEKIPLEQNKKTVESGEWASGSGEQGDVLYTEGAGPCVIIAIYDPTNRIGYLAHSFDPTIDDLANDILMMAIGSTQDLNKLKVFLRGGAPVEQIDAGSGHNTAGMRESVLELFSKHTDVVSAEWTNHLGVATDVTLDCATGEVLTTHTPISLMPE